MNEKPKILILDDQEPWLRTIKNLLEDEYEVVLAKNPVQAIKKTRENELVLAILDQQLGNERGLDVLPKLRKWCPSLPAVICTAFGNDEDERNSLDNGAVAYIRKGSENFIAELKKAVNNHKTRKIVKIFLSYQHNDRKHVDTLFRKLTAKGFVPWMDYRNAIKGEWWPQIEKIIPEQDYFIACFSTHSLRKRRSIFRKELKLALEIQNEDLFEPEVFFIPVRLIDCPIPDAFEKYDFKDVFTKEGFNKLIKILT